MKTRIWYGERYLGKFTCNGKKMTRFQAFVQGTKSFAKKTIVVSLVITAMVWAYMAGYYTHLQGPISPANAQTVASADHGSSKDIPPVLARIMKCESTNSQYSKSGQVVIHVNKDGSYDTGKMQINSIWNATATKMGYDLTKESDNVAFGTWLFENIGTGPWSASSQCWNK